MTSIHAKNMVDSVEKVINHIVWNNWKSTTEDGELTWQSEPMYIIIDNPTDRTYIQSPKLPYGNQFYEEYEDVIINGYKKDASKFEYDYHSRLCTYESTISYRDDEEARSYVRSILTNQIQYIISKLSHHVTSRRAIAITWDPIIDECKKDVPCLQFIQFWVKPVSITSRFMNWISGNTTQSHVLEMFVLFRSEDMLLAYAQNIAGLTKLHMVIANTLNMSVGRYHHMVTIPHIYYKRDKNYLKPWLS